MSDDGSAGASPSHTSNRDVFSQPLTPQIVESRMTLRHHTHPIIARGVSGTPPTQQRLKLNNLLDNLSPGKVVIGRAPATVV